MLFPTIEYMAESRNGKFFCRYVRLLHQLLLCNILFQRMNNC